MITMLFSNSRKFFVRALLPFIALFGMFAAEPVRAESVIATVPTGNFPYAIAVNPVTNKTYVANVNGNTVTVIDNVTHSAIAVEVGLVPRAIAINPVTNKIYVVNTNSGNVTVIDGVTNDPTPVELAEGIGSAPFAIAVNPVTNKIYVTHAFSATVTVVDGETYSVSAVAVGSQPHDVAVNPVTNKIYVADYWSNTVTVIDGATNGASTLDVGFYRPHTIKVNSDTNKIYVANLSTDVTVIDGATNGVSTVSTSGVGGGVGFVAVNPATNKIYVAKEVNQFTTGAVLVIDGLTNSVATVATMVGYPRGLVVNPVTNKIYVANQGANNVMVINGATNDASTVAVGLSPTSIVVNPDTNRLYVANIGDNTVSVIGEVDSIPPVVSVVQTPLPNASGWNNTDVAVSFTAMDSSSTPTCTVNSVTLTAEGAGQVVSTNCTDAAGNSTSASHTVNIDKTSPALTMPSLADNYTIGSGAVVLSFAATDSLSQLASVSATWNGNPVSSGSAVELNQLGANTFTLTATDFAGNTATQTRQITVSYAFGGFLPPLTADSRTTFHLGSVIPVKFELFDVNGMAISTAVAHLSMQQYSGDEPLGDPIDATPTSGADSGNLFRNSSGRYTYNLSTKPFLAGIWRVQATLDDGTVHTIEIGLTSR